MSTTVTLHTVTPTGTHRRRAKRGRRLPGRHRVGVIGQPAAVALAAAMLVVSGCGGATGVRGTGPASVHAPVTGTGARHVRGRVAGAVAVSSLPTSRLRQVVLTDPRIGASLAEDVRVCAGCLQRTLTVDVLGSGADQQVLTVVDPGAAARVAVVLIADTQGTPRVLWVYRGTDVAVGRLGATGLLVRQPLFLPPADPAAATAGRVGTEVVRYGWDGHQMVQTSEQFTMTP